MAEADYASYQQNEQIRQAANDNATREYNAAKLRGEAEDRAQKAAEFAWKKTYDEAGLTGYYQGQATMPTQQWWANTFGTWAAPTAGQQTLAGQQQQFGQAQDLAAMYGQYYAPGTTPTAGMQTQTAQEQAYTQWLRAAQEARANQTAQQQTAQNYLTLLSQLRGPADWAKYQQVLGATPGGMRDLTAAAMGQYIPGGGATTGMQPQAANLNTLQQQVAGGNGTNMYGAQQPGQPEANQMNLPAPNQFAAQTWKNLAPSQQQMVLGQYESQGWYKPDVEALMNQGLPKYAANAPGAGTWRLQ